MPDFTVDKYQNMINGFWHKYNGLDDYHKAGIKEVLRTSKLTIPTGRWFQFHKHHLKDGSYGYKINQIKNYRIQGMSGGDILPLMAVVIRRGMRKLGLFSKLILTVHDSIVFDYCNEEKEKLARLCYSVGNNLNTYVTNYYKIDFNVKLEVEVEVGKSYGELHYLAPEEMS